MPDSAPSFLSPPLTLDGLPGHDIRRLHQISVAIFMQETEAFGVTPVQYAALQAVGHQPGMDQRTLARTIGFDTSTIAGVIDRLESRGLMQRNASAQDRRVRLLTLTAAGGALLAADTGKPFRYNRRESLLNGDFIALGDSELPWRDWL